MKNTFRYEKQHLYADISADMLPKAVSLIKDYLASRLYSDKEKQEDPIDFMDRTLKSMPDSLAQQINLNLLLLRRSMTLQTQERAADEIAAIPETSPYQGAVNITRGYRPANIAEITVEKDTKGKGHIKLYFDSQVGDETRPLMWMQYDALLAKAKEAGFNSDKGSLDQEVEAFKADDSTYFRIGPIDEIMSAFDWSELENVINFLWHKDLPEDMKQKLERK